MYHSITFGDKNTWDDWGLIPTARPVIVPPEITTNYIEVPGRDTVLDLTDFYLGRPVYKQREGEWEFVFKRNATPWDMRYSDILNYLHGKRMSMYLEDDPNYLYTGRFTVSDPQAGQSAMGITIGYALDPFKMDRTNLKNKLL